MGVEDHPAMRGRGGNPYLPHSLRDAVVVPFRNRPAPAAEVVGGVPVGTSVQVQEWVGDDPDRALAALRRERGGDRPRITLVSYLQGVLKRHGVPVPGPMGELVPFPSGDPVVGDVAAGLPVEGPVG